MKPDSNMRTFQTRIQVDLSSDVLLHKTAELLTKVKHSLFAQVAGGKAPQELKNSFLRQFQITARHFNACRVDVEGQIASIKERRPGLIAQTKEKIKSLNKKIASLIKRKKSPLTIHQKKRRLHILQQRLEQQEEDHKQGKVSLCFGTKKLFQAQFNLEGNDYANHEEWQKVWRQKRTSEIFFLGSKDEAGGNQSCTATLQEDNTLSLRIRLPDALKEDENKYLFIHNVHFAYGHESVVTALQNKQAMSWRFRWDEKGWTVFVNTVVEQPPVTSNSKLGVIGLDINIDHLALAETDRFGNPIATMSIPVSLYGKNKNQAKAIISEACKQAVGYAEKNNKPLIIEKLDFQKKKSTLREESSAPRARLLSSFAYSNIIQGIKSRSSKQGIQVISVNPAYTSLIGRVKFSARYGLNIHQAAALCIGRRFLGGSESLPRNLGKIPDGKDGHVALPVPVRIRGEHVWTLWRKISKKLQAALAAHFRTARSRSSSPVTTAPETVFPKIAGGIPARKSSEPLLC